MIADFPVNPNQNIAGIAAFKFAPYYFISSIPSPANKVISQAVAFKAGYGFFIGQSTQDHLNFSENPSNDVNGTSYNWLISGFTPGDSDILADLFEEMEQQRHLVLVTDQLNRLRLVGIDAPLIFTAKYSSGNTPGDAKGYAWQFAGSSMLRAPFYKVG